MAPHWGKVYDDVAVITRILGERVLNGVHRGHVQMLDIGLAKAHVVFGEHVAVREPFDIGNPDERGANRAVVEVEGFYVHSYLLIGHRILLWSGER